MEHRNTHAETVIKALSNMLDGSPAPAASSPEFQEISTALGFFGLHTDAVEFEKLGALCVQLLAARLEGGLHAQVALDQMRQEGRRPC